VGRKVNRRLAGGEPNVCKCVWRHRNVCSSSATYCYESEPDTWSSEPYPKP